MGFEGLHRRAGEHGFVTRTAVTAENVKQRTFTQHSRRLGWEPRHRGLWVPTGAALSYEQEVLAAIEVVGAPALATGLTALFLDGIINEAPDEVELLLPAGRHLAARSGVRLHRSTTFDDVRTHNRHGIAVVAAPRALADAADHTTVNDLCVYIATAIRQRHCLLGAVGKELAKRKRFPGRRVLRVAYCMLTGELPHSGEEKKARRLLRDETAAPHRAPLTVEHAGRLVAEIDIPWPEANYGVEVDGPQHLLPDVAAADRARDRQLKRLGWTIDRFFWFEIDDRPEWFVAQVKAGLAEATAAAGQTPG